MKKNQTVSELDKSLFDRISLNYARKDMYEPSSRARKMRLIQTLKKFPNVSDLRILEVGCGAGYGPRYLNGEFKSYTGIDHSEELIKYALVTNNLPKTEFIAEDLFKFKAEQRFDLIFMIGVLHHLDDMPYAMKFVQQLLKPGGSFVVNEPQDSNIIIQGLRGLRGNVDSSYSKEQVQLNKRALENLFNDAGFLDVQSWPQGYTSTPIAEVILEPEFLFHYLSRVTCRLDAFLEEYSSCFLSKFAWNTVVSGLCAD